MKNKQENINELVDINYRLTATKGNNADYNYEMSVEDWGPVITKLIINTDKKDINFNMKKFKISSIKSDEFESNEKKLDIKNIYLSDYQGTHSNDGKYLTLELKIHPLISSINPLSWNNHKGLNIWDDLRFIIEYKDKYIWDNDIGSFEEIFDKFKFGQYSDEQQTINYSIFDTKEKNKRPLLIWLHGLGEGGEDLRLPVVANKAINLTSQRIQNELDNAYILYPQAPTYWMDNGKQEYTKDGKNIYTHSLQKLIEKIAENYNIDKNRIYLAGASNGGYMVLNQILENPNYYAAGVPIAEGYKDEWLTQDDYQKLLKVPIWFVKTKKDPSFPEELYSEATVKKLKNLAHNNLESSLLEENKDNTGKYKNEEGKKHVYSAHSSWIPFLNDDLRAKKNEIGVYTWMSRCQKENK